nr:MAG TPA: hypothetical protein [Herelleviridae sp.]
MAVCLLRVVHEKEHTIPNSNQVEVGEYVQS